MPSIGPRIRHHLLRRPLRHNLPAAHATLRPQINNPVRHLDHIEVVFDHHHRIALVDQPVQHFEEFADVFEMQPGGRLIEDVERLPG